VTCDVYCPGRRRCERSYQRQSHSIALGCVRHALPSLCFCDTLHRYWGQVHALEALLDAGVPLTLQPPFPFLFPQCLIRLNAGANFHLRDKKGKTPLSYAVQQQQEAAAAFLRQRGSEQCVAAAAFAHRCDNTFSACVIFSALPP
jgi:hypothetical protein